MSRPPSTIHIKRKATDDPVDVLRVHELNGKRQRRATEFVFTRQSTDASPLPNDGLASGQTPAEGTRRIKPLPLPRGQSSGGVAMETGAGTTSLSNKHAEVTQHVNNLTSHLALDDDSEITPLQFAQHRRFHISRTSTARGRQSPVIGGKIQKRTPTVFVERRPQPSLSREERLPVQTEPRTSRITPTAPEQAQAPRPRKKPGLAARTTAKSTLQAPLVQSAPGAAVQNRNIRLPSGLMTPWDVTSEQLAKELEAYTLEEIGRNMAESESTEPKVSTKPEAPKKPEAPSLRIKKGPSKFKPKVPALRYHERHPEVAAAQAAKEAAKEAERDHAEEVGDFVIDTYIRMPAEEVTMDQNKDFGYIVLESQPDIDEFYEEDEQQHEEDEEYDEDDENAENHYTADYPDEEIESDDEYDRNPYRYRNRNASDEEEFDENDYDMADDDDYATRYPWRKPNLPSWMRDEDKMKDDDDDEEGDDDEDNEDGDNYEKQGGKYERKDEREDGENEEDEDEEDEEEESDEEEDDEKGDDDKDMKDAHDAEIIDADGKHNATVAVEKNGGLATTTAQH